MLYKVFFTFSFLEDKAEQVDGLSVSEKKNFKKPHKSQTHIQLQRMITTTVSWILSAFIVGQGK